MKSLKRKFASSLAMLIFLSATQLALAFYDPSLGRWLNRDPIGDKGFYHVAKPRQEILRLTSTTYHFVGNAPIDRFDSVGLSWRVCCRPIRNDPNDSSTTRTGAGLFTHCDLREEPCDDAKDPAFPATKNCDKTKCPKKMWPDGKNCCDVTDQEINDCLKANPYREGAGIPGSNCQSNTRTRLDACCLKSDWKPDWYAYPTTVEGYDFP